MKDTGRVVKTDGSRVLLWAGPLGACFGCMSQECGKARREFWANNRDTLPLKPGMWVRLEPLARRARRQALTAVLLPLLVAIALFIGLDAFIPGLSRDDITLLSVLGFFAVAALVLLVNANRFTKTGPRIERIIGDVDVYDGEVCETRS